MANLIYNMLGGAETNNENKRIINENDKSSIKSYNISMLIISIIAIIVIVILFSQNFHKYINTFLMISFAICVFIIINSLGYFLINNINLLSIDTNQLLINSSSKYYMRNLIYPIIIISILILCNIPRDIPDDNYNNYILNYLFNNKNTDYIIQIGLLLIPVIIGLSELLSNKDMIFYNVILYYGFIGGILGIILILFTFICGFIGDKIPFKVIELNYMAENEIKTNILGKTFGIFNTIVLILTNLTQRTGGIIYMSIIQLILISISYFVLKIGSSGFIFGMLLIIILQIVVFKLSEVLNPIEQGTNGVLNMDIVLYIIFLILFILYYKNSVI